MITFVGYIGIVINFAMFIAITIGLGTWVVTNAKTRSESLMPQSYRILYLFNDVGVAVVVLLVIGWALYQLIAQGVII